MPSESTHEVFISYSTTGNDKVIADAVCAKLENEKIRCWIAPRDVTPGKNWGGEIVEAISRSSIFVLVFSNNSNESQQVLHEVERAVSKGIPVLPFRIEDVTPSTDLEFYLSATHWLDALTPPIEEHIQKLVETIQFLLNPKVSAEKKSEALQLNKDDSQIKSVEEKSPTSPVDQKIDLYDTDLMTWSKNEVNISKKTVTRLRLLAIGFLVVYVGLLILTAATGSCDGPCPEDDDFGAIVFLVGMAISIIAALVSFFLAKQLGFSRLWQILFSVGSFFLCSIPLGVLVFLKPKPRELLARIDKLEKNYWTAIDHTGQMNLALVLARKAFLSYQIGKQNDALLFAEKSLVIADKYQMVNLIGQLKGLSEKIVADLQTA